MERIEEMAALYVKEIRRVETGRAYRLGGWSLGGVVAFEMARQLLGQGARVDSLVLVDSQAGPPERDPLGEDSLLFWTAFAEERGLSWKQLELSAEDFLRMGPDERLSAALRAAQSARLLPSDMGLDEIRPYLDVFRAHVRAATLYEPRPLPLRRTVLFQAAERLEATARDLSEEWNGLTDGLVSHVVSGDHRTILRGENARDLARLIRNLHVRDLEPRRR